MAYTEADLLKMVRDNPQLVIVTDGEYSTVQPYAKPVQAKLTEHEMSEYRLTLPYPVSANRYWRNVKGRMVRSEEAAKYKKAVKRICDNAGIEPLTGDVRVTLNLYRPQRSGDLDNFLKVLGDALIGWAYWDDSQITEIHATRHDDKNNPRVEITITEAI